MTYNELIQSVGKQLKREVYYYNSSNTRVDIDEDDIKEITIKQNCNLTGTLMKNINLVLKEKIQTDKAIYVEITASLGGNTATKTYGPYYLYSCEYNADDRTYSHECYDAMLKTMTEYEEMTLTYPTTVSTFYAKLIETLGLTSNVSLINGSKTLDRDIYYNTGYTYRSVLQDIAEANGVLLYIDGTIIKEASFGTESNVAVIDDDILKNTNIDFGEVYGPINVISLSRAGGGDTIYYPENLPTNIKEYKISDNIMLGENNRDQFIQGIYSKLNGITYNVFDTELVGYGGFDPLQKVRFETGNNVYNSYVFNNEITITTGYQEVIYTDIPSESENTNYSASDTTDNRIKQTYILVNKQTQQIQSVVQDELYNSKGESKISQLTQTVDDLKAEIGKTADITTSSEGTGVRYLENILSSEAIYLQIHPTTEDINFKITNQCKVGNTLMTTPTIYFDYLNNGEVEETTTYDLPKALYYYSGSAYDEYIIDYENNRRYIIHRVGVNTDGTKYRLDTETIEELEYESYSFTESGNYNVYLKGFESAYIKVRAMVSNIYTSQYATRIELNSKIQETSDSILEEVSGKVGENEIIAKINLAVRNDQGIVELTGNSVIINSDNFSLTSSGTINATNANVSGTITTNNGNLGGWVINSSGLNNGAVKINSDGSSTIYTVADLIIIRGYIMGTAGFDLPSAMIQHYDLNGDGVVNALDYTLLQNLIGISMRN